MIRNNKSSAFILSLSALWTTSVAGQSLSKSSAIPPLAMASGWKGVIAGSAASANSTERPLIATAAEWRGTIAGQEVSRNKAEPSLNARTDEREVAIPSRVEFQTFEEATRFAMSYERKFAKSRPAKARSSAELPMIAMVDAAKGVKNSAELPPIMKSGEREGPLSVRAANKNSADPPSAAGVIATRPAYRLGPNDKIIIRTNDIDEVKHEVRITQDGIITLPNIGQVQASGVTAEQLRKEIASRLAKYVRRPDVAVEIVEFHRQPVSVIGAVMNPGVHQVEGHKTLAEVLALAGGASENAGYQLKITRRAAWGAIPLPGAKFDPASKSSIAELDLKVLTEALDPEKNIEVRPDDVISVPRAAMVYVTGEVKKPGGIVLAAERRNLSVLQALALSDGTSPTAAPQKARILRSVANSETRTEIPIDLKSMFAGKSEDMPLQSEDILFIPTTQSQSRKALARIAEAAISTVAGVLIYRSAR